MPDESKSGPLVEDETVVGGIDQNGQASIKPRPPSGSIPESSGFEATDPQERSPVSGG